MKLIKVLFLFLFITFVKSFLGQVGYNAGNAVIVPPNVVNCNGGAASTFSITISKFEYNDPNINISCAGEADGQIKIEITENQKNPEKIATNKGQNIQNIENTKKTLNVFRCKEIFK